MRHLTKLLLLSALASISWLGVSAVPSVSKDADFFSKITYTWRENGEGDEHSATLDKVATDPDQIIAMLRKVYMDRTIPGIYTRGYTSAGVAEGGWIVDQDTKEATSNGNYPVDYSGVGSYSYNYGTREYEYNDAYGWNIPLRFVQYNGRYYIDDAQYVPYEEGYTLLLVEMVDNFHNPGSFPTINNYTQLRAAIQATIKSVRVLTQSTRRYEGQDAVENATENGTWFNIDCDKMNRFFIISKGNPALNNDKSYFWHMFEQFSPSQQNGDQATGIYKKLITEIDNPVPVYHACPSVPYATQQGQKNKGHEFNMLSGPDASAEELQTAPDIRSMLFFVPDYRLQYWGSRDPSGSSVYFFNYNQSHAPIVRLFIITLNPITGTQVVDENGALQHCYKLHLTWESNLKKIFPNSQGEYQLFRVITDENGETTYEPVVQRDPQTGKPVLGEDGKPIIVTFKPDTEEYDDYVTMLPTGQEITYVVMGRDTGHKLSLTPSNEESYLVPGYDKRELLTLRIGADKYSRFDVVDQVNYYWNALPMHNNVGTSVTDNFLSDGNDGKSQSVFTFLRKTDPSATDSIVVATATLIEKGNGKLKFQIDMNDDSQVNFDGAKENAKFIYGTYNTDESSDDYRVVDFGDFVIYDNFSASTRDNTHPKAYYYKAKFTAAEEFTLEDGTTKSTDVHSNNQRVLVEWTMSQISDGSSDLASVQGDTQFNLNVPNDVKYTMLLHPSAARELQRYNIGRWNSDVITEQNPLPHIVGNTWLKYGEAFNSGYKYSLSMGSWHGADKDVTSDEWGTFIDEIKDYGEYNYVPEIEAFRYPKNAENNDLNTYGAPILTTAKGNLEVRVKEPDLDYPLMSETYKWQDDNGTTWYSYYDVYLNIDKLEIPEGYDLYKLRAWRKVEGINDDGKSFPILGECLTTRQPRTQTFNKSQGEDAGDWYLYEDITYGDSMIYETGERMNIEFFTKDDHKGYLIGDRSTKIGPAFGHENGEWAYGTDQEAAIRNEKRATFGAQRLKTELADATQNVGTLEKMKVSFIVRAYFSPKADPEPRTNAPRRVEGAYNWEAPGRKFYIAEAKCSSTFEGGSGVITGVTSIDANREVSGVMYYNTMGLPSVTPWQGVNIVVTRYTDGTTSTTKVVR